MQSNKLLILIDKFAKENTEFNYAEPSNKKEQLIDFFYLRILSILNKIESELASIKIKFPFIMANKNYEPKNKKEEQILYLSNQLIERFLQIKSYSRNIDSTNALEIMNEFISLIRNPETIEEFRVLNYFLKTFVNEKQTSIQMLIDLKDELKFKKNLLEEYYSNIEQIKQQIPKNIDIDQSNRATIRPPKFEEGTGVFIPKKI